MVYTAACGSKMMTTPESAQIIQALLAIPFLLMGLSHIVQPRLWIDFFSYLHSLGPTGVILRTFALELVPATGIITFHWVWSGIELALTIYGLLLMLKIAVSLFRPDVGVKSLAMANRPHNFHLYGAGTVLICLGLICLWSVFT